MAGTARPTCLKMRFSLYGRPAGLKGRGWIKDAEVKQYEHGAGW